MAKATPEQLGWDHTIQRVLVPGVDRGSAEKIQYQIKVGQDTWYQTVCQLADFRANDLVGRATGVWGVVKLKKLRSNKSGNPFSIDDPKTTHALKEFWMDCLGDEEQEAITIKRTRHTLRKWMEAYPDAPLADDFNLLEEEPAERTIDLAWLEPPEEGAYAPDAEPHFKDEEWGDQPYDRYFPHILSHGYVRLSDNRVDRGSKIMHTKVFKTLLLEKGDNPKASDTAATKVLTKTTNKGTTRERSAGQPSGVRKPKHILESARIRDAVHYRQVTEHVGTPLDQVITLNAVVSGVRDAAVGSSSRRRVSRMIF
jgi:hypothetical protein